MEETLKVVQITDPADPALDSYTDWIYTWWGKEQNFSRQQMKENLQRSVFADRLPQTYVAYLGDEPVGGFQFAMSDCYVRPDVYPWIKNVYVDHPYRGRGFAGQMLRTAVEQVKKQNMESMYLFTHLNGFYEQFGWEYLEDFETHLPMGVQRLYVLKG